MDLDFPEDQRGHSVVDPEDEELSKLAQRYRLGMCDAAALALHQHTGWPMALWVGWFHDPHLDEPYYEAAHAVVCDPRVEGRWWDVDGPHDGPPTNLMFDHVVEKIELLPSNEEEIRYAFSMEGVDDASVQQAQADLIMLGVWKQLPAPSPRRSRRPG